MSSSNQGKMTTKYIYLVQPKEQLDLAAFKLAIFEGLVPLSITPR